jgi:hypothetical protein
MAGGNRGLWALHVPLEHLGARAFSDIFSLAQAQAHQPFAEDGGIASPQARDLVRPHRHRHPRPGRAAKHCPCLKKEWVEFLGEHPDPAARRVDPPDQTNPGGRHAA